MIPLWLFERLLGVEPHRKWRGEDSFEKYRHALWVQS
jgi:hypothetical protein